MTSSEDLEILNLKYSVNVVGLCVCVCVLAEHNGRAVPDMGRAHAWVTSCCPRGWQRTAQTLHQRTLPTPPEMCANGQKYNTRARVCLNFFEAGLQSAEWLDRQWMVSWYERGAKQQWSKWRYNHAVCLKRTVKNHKQTRSAAMIFHTLTLRSRSIN